LTIERIFIRKKLGGPQIECAQVQVVAGSGIEGDRYFGRHDEPGQNITLVEAEELEAYFLEQGLRCDLSATHRNLVTRDVRLNEFVGRRFMIGDVSLVGIELCEPCLTLGTSIATARLPAAAVVRRWAHRAGIRADVLSSGIIARGERVTSVA
jgi:MOSC domain-containing protein YiiM